MHGILGSHPVTDCRHSPVEFLSKVCECHDIVLKVAKCLGTRRDDTQVLFESGLVLIKSNRQAALVSAFTGLHYGPNAADKDLICLFQGGKREELLARTVPDLRRLCNRSTMTWMTMFQGDDRVSNPGCVRRQDLAFAHILLKMARHMCAILREGAYQCHGMSRHKSYGSRRLSVQHLPRRYYVPFCPTRRPR